MSSFANRLEMRAQPRDAGSARPGRHRLTLAPANSAECPAALVSISSRRARDQAMRLIGAGVMVAASLLSRGAWADDLQSLDLDALDKAEVDGFLGRWRIRNEAGDRSCDVVLEREMTIGGLQIDVDPACAKAFPVMDEIAAWRDLHRSAGDRWHLHHRAAAEEVSRGRFFPDCLHAPIADIAYPRYYISTIRRPR